MYQIDNASAAASQPPSSAAGTAGFFTDGNPATNLAATIVPAEWLNAVMMELLNAVTAAGVTPSKTQFNQLATAISNEVNSSAAASLKISKNLSDVASPAASCANIGAVQKAGDAMTGMLRFNTQSGSPNYTYGAVFGTGTIGPMLTYNIAQKILYTTDSTGANSNLSIDDSGNLTTRGAVKTPTIQFSTGNTMYVSSGNTWGVTNIANNQWNIQVDDNGNATMRGTATIGLAATIGGLTTLNAGLNVPAGGVRIGGFTNANPALGAGGGLTINWNESSGNGETDLVNCAGGGVGGFTFRSVNSGNTVQNFVCTIDSFGGFHAASNLWAGSAEFYTNGDINGSGWGGLLSSSLNGRFGNCMTRTDGHGYQVGWDAGQSHLNFSVDGVLIAYVASNVSDRALKTNVQSLNPDSLALVEQIAFSSYDIDTRHVEMGVIAQELEAIAPRWTYQAPAPEPTEDNPEPATPPLMFDTQALLFDALQAIKQLSARVVALEARLAPQ